MHGVATDIMTGGTKGRKPFAQRLREPVAF
jgi:hypothetical protein